MYREAVRAIKPDGQYRVESTGRSRVAQSRHRGHEPYLWHP